MSTAILDPSWPADKAPIVSGEMRGQFARLVEGANGKAEIKVGRGTLRGGPASTVLDVES